MTDHKTIDLQEIMDKFTIDGKPIYSEIKTDPETGDLLSYEFTPEIKAQIEAREAEIQQATIEMLNGNGPQADKARKALAEAKAANAQMKAVIKEIRESVLNSDTIKEWRKMAEQLQPITAALDELQELTPFLKAELKKPEYKGVTLDELLKDVTPAELLELPEYSTLYKAMQAARAAKAQAVYTDINRADIVEYPLDKPNSRIWNLLENNMAGQIAIQFNMLPTKPNLQATAIYSINFDNLGDLKITKRLTPFDKRVYIAASALFNAGNDVITLSQIYYAMGYTGRPGTKDLTRINDACSKMTGAKILFDNKAEADALDGYPHFKYDGPLLPFERITAIVGGQISEGAIKLFREPPLMSFAKQRHQVTTIDVKLLQSPISKTDANLLIDDYLIERISKAKKGKGSSCKILFKTLYERTNITTKKQKQRAPEKITKYLNYYQQQEFIKRYTMQPDGIIVYFEGE